LKTVCLKNQGNALEKFTKRFQGRIGSLPDDKDISVACAGIRLCSLLAKQGKLDQDHVDHIYELVAERNATVRAAAGEFALSVYFAEGNSDPLDLLRFCESRSPELVVRALWGSVPPAWLCDWDKLTGTLLQDKDGLNNEQQAVLAALIAAAVEQSAKVDSKAAATACSTVLVGCVHKLLKRFKADAVIVRHVVSLVTKTNPELFASLRKGANHKKTVELLGEIFSEHHDADLVRDALSALLHLSNPNFSLAGEARAVMQSAGERAVVAFSSACSEGHLATDQDAQFRLSHSIMQLSVAARQIDLNMTSAQVSALKRLVDDSLGGLGYPEQIVKVQKQKNVFLFVLKQTKYIYNRMRLRQRRRM
jgi:hypothetical protein